SSPKQDGDAAEGAFFQRLDGGPGVLGQQTMYHLGAATCQDDAPELVALAERLDGLVMLPPHLDEDGREQVEAVGAQRQVAEAGPVRLDLQPVAAKVRGIECLARLPGQRLLNCPGEELLLRLVAATEVVHPVEG